MKNSETRRAELSARNAATGRPEIKREPGFPAPFLCLLVLALITLFAYGIMPDGVKQLLETFIQGPPVVGFLLIALVVLLVRRGGKV